MKAGLRWSITEVVPSSPAPARLAGGLLAGARIALSGLRFSLGSTAIRRSYARMLMAMALGGALLFVLLFGLTLYFSWPEGEVEGEHIALWVAGFFISMVLAPLTSILGVRILAPTFAEQVLHTALREHSPDLAQRATDAKGLSFMTGLILSLIHI